VQELSLAASERSTHMIPFMLSHIPDSHAINGLSFSHDGEYLAISNTNTYIDIVSLHSDDALSALLTRFLSALWKLACQSIEYLPQVQCLR